MSNTYEPENTCNGFKALFILVGAVCFGTSGTIQALAPEGATPFVVGALRMTVGGLALMVWCFLTGKFRTAQKMPLKNLLLSALALVGFQLSFFSGVQLVGVAVGTVVAIGFSPVAAALLAIPFLKEYPKKMWYFSTVIAVVGLVLLNFDAAGNVEVTDMLLPLVAGFSYGCYFIFSKPLGQKNSPDFVMMTVCLLSSCILFPVYFLYPVEWIFSFEGIMTSLGLGVITTAMAFSFVLAGLKYTTAANGATLALAEPLVAACLGIFFLKEPVSANTLIGIACILLGVILLGVTQKDC